MPRPRGGPLTAKASKPVSFRVPRELLAVVEAQCGGPENLAQWLRNVVRHACTIPLDFEAGYDEGFRAGWADAKVKWTEAMQRSTR